MRYLIALLLFAITGSSFAAGQWTYVQTPNGRVWSHIELDTTGRAPTFTPTTTGGEFTWGAKLDTTQGMVDIDMRTEYTAANLKRTALKAARTLGNLSGTIGTIVTVAELLQSYGLNPDGSEPSEVTPTMQGTGYKLQSGPNGSTCIKTCVAYGSAGNAARTALVQSANSVCGTSGSVSSGTCGHTTACTSSTQWWVVSVPISCEVPTNPSATEEDILARYPTTPSSDVGFLAGLPPPAWPYAWDASGEVSRDGGRRTVTTGPPSAGRTTTKQGPCPAPATGECTTTTRRQVPLSYPPQGADGEAPSGAPDGSQGSDTGYGPGSDVEIGPTTETSDTTPNGGGEPIENSETTSPTPKPGTNGSGSGGGSGSDSETVTAPEKPECEAGDPVASWNGFKDRLYSAVVVEMGSLSPVCPTPSFDWFDRALTFESHCEILAEQKDAMRTFMVLAWSMLAGLIVLRA